MHGSELTSVIQLLEYNTDDSGNAMWLCIAQKKHEGRIILHNTQMHAKDRSF